MSGEGQITNGRECGGDAAAYVLGALEPAEAEAFRRHIADCSACQRDVAEFEQITGALSETAAQYPASKDLRRRVLREVRATPKAKASGSTGSAPVRAPMARSRLLAWGGAIAAAAVVVAVIILVALSSGGSGGARVIQASVSGSSVSAELRINGGHGDLIVHRLPRLPSGRIYEMWVQRGNAQPTPTGTLFSVTQAGTAAVGVPGSLSGVSAVMVTQEPAGGTLVPTSAPVIVARVT